MTRLERNKEDNVRYTYAPFRYPASSLNVYKKHVRMTPSSVISMLCSILRTSYFGYSQSGYILTCM